MLKAICFKKKLQQSAFQHIPGTAFELAYKNILTTRTAKLVRWLQVQLTTSLLTAV